MTTKLNGNLWKYAIYIAGVLFAVGIYCATIQNNTSRIDKVELKASKTETEFVEFRGEMRTSIINIEKGIGNIQDELKNK